MTNRQRIALLIAVGATGVHAAAAQSVPRLLGGDRRDRPGSDFAGQDPLGRGAAFSPFVDTLLRTNISNNGRFRLYGDLSGGASGFINRDRVQGSGNFRLTFRQPITGSNTSQRLTANGLGKATVDLVRNRLFVDFGAYATVTDRDLGQGFSFDAQNGNGNLSQIYLLSVKPRVQKEIGTLAIFSGSYKAAYTGVDNRIGGGGGTSGGSGNGGGRFGGGLQLRPYSNTFSQRLEGSVANQPHDGRFSIKLSGNLGGEEQERLGQRFRSRGGSGELTYAVTRVVSLVGSVGYESYKSSRFPTLSAPLYLRVPQAGGLLTFTNDPAAPDIFTSIFGTRVLRDFYVVNENPARGVLLNPGPNFLTNPVFSTQFLDDPRLVFASNGQGGTSLVPVGIGNAIDETTGEFIVDRGRGRITTYRQRGLVWNGGFRYVPSRRTYFELRVGQRFQDVTVTGSVRHQFSNGLAINGSATDGIETFSSILTQVIDGVPTSFVSNGRGLSGLGGCVRGPDTGDSTGCLGGQTQSVSSGVFRSRIARIGADYQHGKTHYSVDYSYNNRRYLDPGEALGPDAPVIDPTLGKREDVIQRFVANVGHRFDKRQSLTLSALYGINGLGLRRSTTDNYVALDARYNLRVNARLDLLASVSGTQRFSSLLGDRLTNTFALGARYNF